MKLRRQKQKSSLEMFQLPSVTLQGRGPTIYAFHSRGFMPQKMLEDVEKRTILPLLCSSVSSASGLQHHHWFQTTENDPGFVVLYVFRSCSSSGSYASIHPISSRTYESLPLAQSEERNLRVT